MKTKTKTLKSYSTSEASQRKALKIWKAGFLMGIEIIKHKETVLLRLYSHSRSPDVDSIFDIRDCYRKRAPLKGINKEVAKLVRKRRK